MFTTPNSGTMCIDNETMFGMRSQYSVREILLLAFYVVRFTTQNPGENNFHNLIFFCRRFLQLLFLNLFVCLFLVVECPHFWVNNPKDLTNKNRKKIRHWLLYVVFCEEKSRNLFHANRNLIFSFRTCS